MKKFLMGFEDFDTFVQYTGMLIEDTDWDSAGIHPDNENGSFDLSRLNELRNFCLMNPAYHVLTETTDGDEFSDENTMPPITISNRIRSMNRFEYYLGTGSKRAFAELFHWTGWDRPGSLAVSSKIERFPLLLHLVLSLRK